MPSFNILAFYSPANLRLFELIEQFFGLSSAISINTDGYLVLRVHNLHLLKENLKNILLNLPNVSILNNGVKF